MQYTAGITVCDCMSVLCVASFVCNLIEELQMAGLAHLCYLNRASGRTDIVTVVYSHT